MPDQLRRLPSRRRSRRGRLGEGPSKRNLFQSPGRGIDRARDESARRDMEVVAMPKWPIRVKLIAGLTLVVGMMLILMGGSIFGLHAFHTSNLKLVDQLRELGASKDLLQFVFRLEVPRSG